jgi:hypothetical protein
MDANRSRDMLGFTIDFNTVDFHWQRLHLQRWVLSLYCQSCGVLLHLWQGSLQDAVGARGGGAAGALRIVSSDLRIAMHFRPVSESEGTISESVASCAVSAT